MARREDLIQELEIDPAPPSSRNGEPPLPVSPNPRDLTAVRAASKRLSAERPQPRRLTVEVRKPSKEWFFMVHDDPAYQVQVGLLELKDQREMYFVVPALWEELEARETTFHYFTLYTCVTRQQEPFLWPVRLPEPGERSNPWTESAQEIAHRAQHAWVRMQANRQTSGYTPLEGHDGKPPRWPAETLQELIDIAFKRTTIDRLDHPVLLELLGE